MVLVAHASSRGPSKLQTETHAYVSMHACCMSVHRCMAHRQSREARSPRNEGVEAKAPQLHMIQCCFDVFPPALDKYGGAEWKGTSQRTASVSGEAASALTFPGLSAAEFQVRALAWPLAIQLSQTVPSAHVGAASPGSSVAIVYTFVYYIVP